MKCSTNPNCNGDLLPVRELKINFTATLAQVVPMFTSSVNSLYGSSFCTPVIFRQTCYGCLFANIVVCALWMSFRNAASLSKRVLKLSLCYVDQKFFWSVGGARGRERTDFEQAFVCWPLYFWFFDVTPSFVLQSARVISLWKWLAFFKPGGLGFQPQDYKVDKDTRL